MLVNMYSVCRTPEVPPGFIPLPGILSTACFGKPTSVQSSSTISMNELRYLSAQAETLLAFSLLENSRGYGMPPGHQWGSSS